MHWLLTPLDRHSDDGFGAIATAFRASAETLLAAEKDSMAQQRAADVLLAAARGRVVSQIDVGGDPPGIQA